MMSNWQNVVGGLCSSLFWGAEGTGRTVVVIKCNCPLWDKMDVDNLEHIKQQRMSVEIVHGHKQKQRDKS
jgi:molybdopterin-guanine dinucleotide biosynthesis protein A